MECAAHSLWISPPPPAVRTTAPHCHTLHPWLGQYSNNWSSRHQLQPVTVPDINPALLPRYGLFSMAAGDFLQVYTEEGLRGGGCLSGLVAAWARGCC